MHEMRAHYSYRLSPNDGKMSHAEAFQAYHLKFVTKKPSSTDASSDEKRLCALATLSVRASGGAVCVRALMGHAYVCASVRPVQFSSLIWLKKQQCVRVCACVNARARACVRACVRVCMFGGEPSAKSCNLLLVRQHANLIVVASTVAVQGLPTFVAKFPFF